MNPNPDHLSARVEQMPPNSVGSSDSAGVNSDTGEMLVSITVGGSTHTRTANEWVALSRADLRSVHSTTSWKQPFKLPFTVRVEIADKLAESHGLTRMLALRLVNDTLRHLRATEGAGEDSRG